MKDDPIVWDEFIVHNFEWIGERNKKFPIELDEESRQKLDQLTKKILADYKQKQTSDESTNQG